MNINNNLLGQNSYQLNFLMSSLKNKIKRQIYNDRENREQHQKNINLNKQNTFSAITNIYDDTYMNHAKKIKIKIKIRFDLVIIK